MKSKLFLVAYQIGMAGVLHVASLMLVVLLQSW